ncbi:MAG: hypothetical protein HFH14_02505 [Lachnospiraceae bacterium]|nr:hypothetical protein [Lachnospiraceae bacterium]
MMKKKTALTITALSALCMACMIVLNADAVSAKRINLCMGDTYQLKAGRDIKVKISNPGIVKHLKKGKVRALKCGKCTVKVIKGKKVKKYSFVIKKKTSNKKDKKRNRKNAEWNGLNTLIPDKQNQNAQTPNTPVPDVTVPPDNVTKYPVGDDNGAILDVPMTGTTYYRAETPESMIHWMNSPDAKTVKDGAFKNIVELYSDIGFICVPSVQAGNTGISKVEVGSRYSTMTFYCGVGNSVSINPLSAEEKELCNNSDVLRFLAEKQGIILNENQNIYEVFDGVEQNTVIGTKCWTEDSILVDGSETRCLMCTKKYNDGTNFCQKMFVYDGFIVYISTYNVNTDDADFMKSVSFTKMQMK